jgi:hypothetical protein
VRFLATLCLMAGIAHADAPDDVRKALAAAFAKKDEAAIERLVSDPYSGLRWCSGWDDARWKKTARTLEEAKRVESTPRERVYQSGERRFTIESLNGDWKLDLSSLLGPFPHM